MTVTQRSPRTLYSEYLLVPDLQTSEAELQSTTTIGDGEVSTYHADSAFYNYSLTVPEGCTVINQTPDVCDVSALPTITRVAAGQGLVNLWNGRITLPISLNMEDLNGTSVNFNVLEGIASGSLTDFLWADIIQPLLVGDPATKRSLFANDVFLDATDYTLNSTCWAAGFDFSGVPVKSSDSGTPMKCGALITRRHLSQARHYHTPVGSVITFRRSDGALETRTVIGVSSQAGVGYSEDDSCVVTLSAPNLPVTVKSYSIVGDWSYTITSGPTSGVYTVGATNVGLWINRYRKVFPFFCLTPSLGSYFRRQGSVSGVSYDFPAVTITGNSYIWPSPLLDWVSGGAGGDSSSPMFMPLSGSDMAFAGNAASSLVGLRANESLLNSLIAAADAAAGISTGLTVTVAPDPTL